MNFEHLAAGDSIGIGNRYGWGTQYSIASVDRVTKTQIVIGNRKYYKSNGILVGCSNQARIGSWLESTENANRYIEENKRRNDFRQAAYALRDLMQDLGASTDEKKINEIQAKLDALRALL